MLNDYFSTTQSLVLFLMFRDEINILREKLYLPLYSEEELKKEFRKRVIKLGQVCDSELSNPELAFEIIKDIKKIQRED